MYSSQTSSSFSRELRQPRSQGDLYASLGLEIDVGKRGPYQPRRESRPKKTQPSSSYCAFLPSKSFLWRIFAYLVIAAYFMIAILQLKPSQLSALTESVSLKVLSQSAEDELHFEEEIPTYFRDVVLDLPVDDTDVPIMWTHDGADSDSINSAYLNCYDVDISEQAVQDLSSFGRRRIYHISDLQLQTIDDIVTEKSHGRMFAFFRHPYYGFQERSEVTPEDNPLTRVLAGGFKGKLTFKELGVAKRYIRERFVIGLLDENLIESFQRIADYFGWTETGGPMCISKFLSTVNHDHYGELMHEKSEQWGKFMEAHTYDLQIYEFARSTYRGQKQTIISFEKQILYKEMNEN